MDWNWIFPIYRKKRWVTPCVGVWIETYNKKTPIDTNSHTLRGCVDWNRKIIPDVINSLSHTLRGCVDWNKIGNGLRIYQIGHTLRGCVDWNNCLFPVNNTVFSHTLRGCVDWNLRSVLPIAPPWVTPCVGVWIETKHLPKWFNLSSSHPAWVCGLKLKYITLLSLRLVSHPAWVCGLKLFYPAFLMRTAWSHPAWVCGLKLRKILCARFWNPVTPCVGVWIETR